MVDSAIDMHEYLTSTISSTMLVVHVSKAPSTGHNLQSNGGDNDESSSEDGDQEGSYENVVGAYNVKDFATLNVTPEIRDLFQHIERYKPHEVELESTLKCFIPEYIPAIGEMDAFIKVGILRYTFIYSVKYHVTTLSYFTCIKNRISIILA